MPGLSASRSTARDFFPGWGLPEEVHLKWLRFHTPLARLGPHADLPTIAYLLAPEAAGILFANLHPVAKGKRCTLDSLLVRLPRSHTRHSCITSPRGPRRPFPQRLEQELIFFGLPHHSPPQNFIQFGYSEENKVRQPSRTRL